MKWAGVLRCRQWYKQQKQLNVQTEDANGMELLPEDQITLKGELNLALGLN